MRGCDDCIRVLLKAGADINATNNPPGEDGDYCTCLDYYEGDDPSLKLESYLIKKGAIAKCSD